MQRALCRALSTELRNVYGKYPRFYWPDSIPNNYCNFHYKFIGPNVILILFKRLQNNYVEKLIAETYHMTREYESEIVHKQCSANRDPKNDVFSLRNILIRVNKSNI